MEDNFVIPSMGGGKLNKIFFDYAKAIPSGGVAVELGTWCGAGTRALVKGVKESGNDVEIHGYDDFIIQGNEVDKAAKFGVKLKQGQNILPLVKKWLYVPGVKLNLHQGEITKNKWDGKPIYLYIDDACKYEENFIKALKIFSPSWVPMKTIVVLMDYYFYLARPNDKKLEFQKNFIESRPESFKLKYVNKKLGTAIFLYKGGLSL
jgi:hypothetical protein